MYLNIRKNGDYSIINFDNETLMNKLSNGVILNSKKIYITKNEQIKEAEYICFKQGMAHYITSEKDEDLYDFSSQRLLIGKHNEFNIMVALGVSKILNLDLDKSVQGINEFKTLPHRLEFVGTVENVDYYNDSIATIPESTINCVDTLEKLDTILVGGMDRGIDYLRLSEFLANSKVRNIICMPDTGYTIYNQVTEVLSKNKVEKNVVKVKDLVEAVEVAKKITKKGYQCALSPAAASYGIFKNFEERGSKFKELILKK